MAPLLPDTILFREVFRRESGRHLASICLSSCRPEILESSRHKFLTSTEEDLWQRFQFQRRRQSHLLGRYCAKEAIACQGSLASLSGCEIDAGVFQQPVVRGPGAGRIQVSISHSESLGAALAFDEGHPMGIDLELVAPDRRSTIQSQLTGAELDFLAAGPLPIDDALGLVWTVKEALAKTLRTGLMTPLTIYEISEPKWEAKTLSCEFSAFGQYRAIGFLVSQFALGLVLPRRSELTCSMATFRSRFSTLATPGNPPGSI